MVRNQAHACLGITLLTLMIWSPAPSLGQAQGLSQLLAPCIDEQTAAIVRVDVTRVNVDASFDMVIETASGSMDAEEMEEIKIIVNGLRQVFRERFAAFKAAGGDTFFLVSSVDDLPHFRLVVPVTPKVRESAMKDWVDSMLKDCYVQVRKGGLIVAGSEFIMKQWDARSPAVRPELDRAVAEAREAAIQVFLIPDANSRRVLQAMLPILLNRSGRIPDRAVTDGLQWAVHSINLPPRLSVDVHIESADPASALALREVITAALSLVRQIPQLKEAYPNLGATLAMVTPVSENNTLRLTLDERQCIRVASNLLTRGLFTLRMSILRDTCGTTLSGMGKAMLIYANDYADEWPPDLETLVEKAEYPRSGLICPAMKHRPDYESYVYRGVDLGGSSANPGLIMVHDRAGNHKGGRNVLFADTHVEWFTEDEFQGLIERDNQLRRGAGLAEKPAP